MPILLQENFSLPELDPQLQWFSPPRHWRIEPQARHLIIEPDSKTDFWQKTHYGFQVDNGHFLFFQTAEEVTLTVTVTMNPHHQYDQAGAMVRFSPDCWIKTSVEYEQEGPSKLGAVVTNHGYSDWSTQDFQDFSLPLHFRITRQGNDYQIFCASGDLENSWTQLRITHLAHPPQAPVYFGLFACSPVERGLQARFSSLKIESIEKTVLADG
ncbi:MAG TPA: DUF1349 domain-containing protein [Atribacteraceae bacterium]|nr:DUF1349 domain-containing protein [Atribacteraceae bacterium]